MFVTRHCRAPFPIESETILRPLSLVTNKPEAAAARPDRGRVGVESVDDRKVCLIRLILACSALLIIYIDPSEPDRFVAITYGALILYSAYSAALYYLARRQNSSLPVRAIYWVDVGWYLLLIALSSGTNSIFFFFLFFVILVASFRRGFRAGLRVTLTSATLFTVIGYATRPPGPDFELNRFLLRPIYLVVLGYLIAYWGGAEIELKRRLALLKEVNTLSNPRFGITRTTHLIMRKLLDFYDADACLLIMPVAVRGEYQLSRIGRTQADGEVQSERIPAGLARQLLVLSGAAAYNVGRFSQQSRSWRAAEGREACAAIALTIDAGSFISVPLFYRDNFAGRVYLTGQRGLFDSSDVDFLMQVIEQLIPVLDNIRLLDQLTSKAAEQERQKIARDLHDTVIQPYIGLQYKLGAIRNKLAAGKTDVGEEINRLFDVTVNEITGLRHYVRGFKDTSGGGDLLSAMHRYAEQFQENYGIAVRIVCKSDLIINDRLAAELIQIVHEGLSNVHKHTGATLSTISVESRDGTLVLCIENDGAPVASEQRASFIPRSITERAEALGGRVCVEQIEPCHARVEVKIPL
jgi:signal transduction histidine kinase